MVKDTKLNEFSLIINNNYILKFYLAFCLVRCWMGNNGIHSKPRLSTLAPNFFWVYLVRKIAIVRWPSKGHVSCSKPNYRPSKRHVQCTCRHPKQTQPLFHLTQMKRLPAPAHAYPTRQKDHQVTIIPSLSIQNPNMESKKWREIKRSYRGHLGNEEKNYFLSFFPLSVKTLVFPSSSGKTKTKGGAEKSKRRRTVAGKTTSLHRFRRFELDSGV